MPQFGMPWTGSQGHSSIAVASKHFLPSPIEWRGLFELFESAMVHP
jgi:hypothetical protein